MVSGYTLYVDGGGIVYPTAQSIYDICGPKGFGQNTRGAFYVNYTEDCIKVSSDGTKYIENAKLTGGLYLPVNRILTLQEADSLHLTSADSTFYINKVDNFWAYRGYLNVMVTSGYTVKNFNRIEPTFTLTYNTDSIRTHENELYLKLYYNRHSDKTGASSATDQFVESFPLSDLGPMIPGNDSVLVSFEYDVDVDKTRTLSMKVSRTDFSSGNYKGFTSGFFSNK